MRGEALITSLADIEKIVVGVSPTGTPILVRNLGDVRFAPMVRQGFATQDGKGEIVVGVAMMLDRRKLPGSRGSGEGKARRHPAHPAARSAGRTALRPDRTRPANHRDGHP